MTPNTATTLSAAQLNGTVTPEHTPRPTVPPPLNRRHRQAEEPSELDPDNENNSVIIYSETTIIYNETDYIEVANAINYLDSCRTRLFQEQL